MKKLLVGFVVLLVVAAVAVEVVAPRLAARAIEDRVRARTEGVVGVSADVGPFPVVTRLLATERVPRLRVTFDEVAGRQLTFASVSFELRGVRLDRDALLSGNVRVRGMRGGEVTAVLDAEALSEALGVPVTLAGGRVRAQVAGVEVDLPLVLDGRALRVPPGLPAIGLPDMVPCTAADTVVSRGRVHVSCAIDDVPFFLT